MAHTNSPAEREVLLEQALMILRASEESVPEAADRAGVQRRYELVEAAQRTAETSARGR
jgi:uncharacterized membrane protein